MSARPKATPDVCLDANLFMLAHGRMPQLGRDPIPPWRYRGWLLLITQVCDHHPMASQRWPYYLRTMEAGKLLDEPIPRIEFHSSHEPVAKEGMKMIEKAVDIIFEEIGTANALPALLDWLGYGMATTKEPPRLSGKVQEKLYRHWNLEPLLKVPSDYFGTLMCEYHGKGWRNARGFYPTPHNVVEMMTRMVMHDYGWKPGEPPPKLPNGRDSRLATVCDPAIGTGRMTMHASNYSLCLYGMDIDPLVVAACKINGVLYAPWMTFPFPQRILDTGLGLGIGLGNSLLPSTSELTHRDIPAPPAPLPGCPIPDGLPLYRCDDRGQGLLFTL